VKDFHPAIDPLELERRDLGPDEGIVARVLAGEEHLFEVIMRRHNQRLYRAARSILREDDEAEDVMQDAYVRAYSHLRDFHGDAAFSTWLTRIAVHEALARLRRRKRNPSLDDELGAEDDLMNTEERTPEQRTHDAELRVVLEQAVDALPPAFRVVFVMRSVEDMSTADTAATLGIPEDTVKTRLFRARALLQKSLAERLEATSRDAFSFQRPRCDRVVHAVLERIRARAVSGT
jgi:RNA polymerase sigma-70 factor (ECF subfamily)